jgi:hypothetical protein
MTGWYALSFEYGTKLRKPQHVPPSPPGSGSQVNRARLARDVLQQLRYDDRFSLESLRAIVQDGGTQAAVGLSSWVFDPGEPGWMHPSKVQTIERIWDGVHVWNPDIGLERLSDFDAIDEIFGVATWIANDNELVAATGIRAVDAGEEICRAEFERLDGSGGVVQGIVCPSRWGEPGEQGIMVNQGEGSLHNRRLVAGTALQDVEWADVVEYRQGLRRSPLW